MPSKDVERALATALAIAGMANSAVQAQEVATPLMPIIVTGRGLGDTPATSAYDVQTIDRERIEASASGRLEDVLSAVAGFQQFRRSDSRSANSSAQGVTLRALGGNASSRTLVLLDGVPQADPLFGAIAFSALAPERLQSVRVTRGGGAGAFGAGAVAGTIELTSAGPATLGLLSGDAAIDQRGESEVSATLAPRLGDGFLVLSARRDRGEGFFTTPVAQRVPASVRAAYESWSTQLRAVVPVAPGWELQTRGLVFEDHRVLRFAGANTASRGADASVRVVGHGRWQVDALAYVQARDFANVVISATSFLRTLDQRRTPSTGAGGKLEVRPPVGRDHVAKLGGDLRIAGGDLFEDAYVAGRISARRYAGGRNTDLGLFLEDDWTPSALSGRIALTAGARADRWTIRDGYFREIAANAPATIDRRFADRAGWQGSFRGGVVWRPVSVASLRASAYQGLRLPTLNELYRPFVVFPVTTRANAALRNERLFGYEAGIDITLLPRMMLSLTAFDNRVAHAIANVTIAPNLRERRNVDAVHARGIEATATAAFGALSFDASLALTHARVEARDATLDGRRPAQTPRIAASATLAWCPHAGAFTGWLASATLRHTGAQFEDDLETDLLPSVMTLDAVLRVPLTRSIGLVLRAENLGDAAIVTRNQGGSIDLGAPRTVWIGIRMGLS